MRVSSITAAAILATSALAAVAPRANVVSRGTETSAEKLEQLVDDITEQFMQDLDDSSSEMEKRGQGSCSVKNIGFRKEYGSMSKKERLAYVNAVKCLQQLPARTPASVAPGAKSRFDDFVVTHIQQTLSMHYTGNFMAWHRWFVHVYETALRDECGYTGYQPYWDWPRYASAPQDSPLFDGSPYSLGGNGEYVPHDGTTIEAPPGIDAPAIYLPPGMGGGFVTTGPFANMTVNLGPVAGAQGVPPGPDGGLGYNPRGLRRDVGPAVNMRYANYTTILQLMTSKNIEAYRLISEGNTATGEMGPHGGVHYVIHGDPGGDLFTSPGDPAFWTHHSMMDRMWTLWQVLDPKKRYTDLNAGTYGHRTWMNQPESPLATLDDVLDMGYAGPSTTIREVMYTTKGALCYFYL